MSLPKIFRVVLCALTFFVAVGCPANESEIGITRVFTHESGAKLFLTPYGNPKDKTFLVRFEGFNDPWDGKVILHHAIESGLNTKYEIRIETGNKFHPNKSYASIVNSKNKTLINGSIVPVIEVNLPSKSEPLFMEQAATDQKISEEILKTYQTQNYKVTF